jgi:hypothetical protein
MRTAREQAEELRQEAIRTLLEEKAAIEEMLALLSFQKEATSLMAPSDANLRRPTRYDPGK